MTPFQPDEPVVEDDDDDDDEDDDDDKEEDEAEGKSSINIRNWVSPDCAIHACFNAELHYVWFFILIFKIFFVCLCPHAHIYA